ncbi:restriction endonuclease subunit S [Chlorogloeopsis sp. ULAP02]|uniref:restriction endonuclease subunit S n=1 Tax=Chlorogloeopsis sp. ULAP02 TaxID=3107926 RepID=UPI0031374DF6
MDIDRWQQVSFDSVVNINPTRQLQRGKESAYVAMEDLKPFTRTISNYGYRQFTGSGSRFSNNDILLARITPCLENGKTAFVDFLEDGEVAHGSTEFIVLTGKAGVTDSLFIYYLTRSNEFRDFAIAMMEGTSGRQRVPTNALKRYEFFLPPFQEQKAIARILSSLDDKIQLNQQMNRTLEAQARAIFKSWFVDFDPVRAKMEGRQPAGMDAATAELFPDSFEDSPLGMIPKGWNVKTIGDICEFAYGKALKAEDRQPGDVPVYGSNGQIGWHNQVLVKDFGIVVGRKGNPGVVTWVSKDFYPIDTTFYVIPKSEIRSLHYLFHALSNIDLASLGADSAVPGLNRNLAYMTKILVSDYALQKAFHELISILSKQVDVNIEQSRTLSVIRDTLLPKLMSGEIRVREAEKIVGEAA